MYLRTTKRKNRDGSEVVYYQLAESVWNPEKKRAEAKIAYNFGRADQVDPDALRRLAESISRVCDDAEISRALAADGVGSDDLEVLPAKGYGGLYVIEELWRRVGLAKILDGIKKDRRGRAPHEVAIFAMVANRLLAPTSKLACYDWLQKHVHFPAGDSLALSHLYRAMDYLGAHAAEIEKKLFWHVADLLSLDVDLIFFDTTTTYFEVDEEDAGKKTTDEDGTIEEKALRKRGYSKDKRKNNPQVVVALAVTRDGLPVRSWVFPGNAVDTETVAKVRQDLKSWRLSRTVFVGDAGMYSAENKKILSAGGGRYLLATPLRKVKEIHDVVLRRAGRYKRVDEKLEVKEVTVGDGEARRRYLLCRNLEEARRAKQHREQVLEELKAELEALGSSENDHPKRACELLSSKRYGRYLKKLKSGRPALDKKKIRDEERFDGKWVVTTNDDSLSSEDGALGYKALLIIESCFRRMKTTGLKLRPVFHWTEPRIVAHVKLCVLALLLQRVAEIECDDTWRNVRDALTSLQVVEFVTPTGTFVRTTLPSADALGYLKKLKLSRPPKVLEVRPTPAPS